MWKVSCETPWCGNALAGAIHKKLKEGGISTAAGTRSIYTVYSTEEQKFKSLMKRDLVLVMPSLVLADVDELIGLHFCFARGHTRGSREVDGQGGSTARASAFPSLGCPSPGHADARAVEPKCSAANCSYTDASQEHLKVAEGRRCLI
ncbi:unnamed protein product [Symbiodinium sp. CCMP2592]|nr:unnamed protein product [Symbiodinium sp. CCMP2592]